MSLPDASWPARIQPVPCRVRESCRLELRFVTDQQAPVNMAGLGVWRGQARPSPESARAATFIIDTTTAAAGTVVATLTGEQTAVMAGSPNSTWGFDLTVTPDGQDPITVVTGKLAVQQVYTR